MSPDAEVSGILVLKAVTGLRSNEPKRYTIVRAVSTNDVNVALADLPEGQYVAVDPGTLKPYEVEYVTVQKNHALSA